MPFTSHDPPDTRQSHISHLRCRIAGDKASGIAVRSPMLLRATSLVALALTTATASAQTPLNARWIQSPTSTPRDGAELDGSRPMPIFRREFTLTRRPASATLRIAGLGQFDVTLDAHAILPPGLHGAWTDYRKTVPYQTYPVSLTPGHHTLTVLLGNGMYNVQQTKGRYTKFEGTFGPPKLLAELTVRYRDGVTETIPTDATWQAAPGPVTFSSTYGGEDYDARVVPTGWTPAQLTESPGGALTVAIAPEFLLAHTYATPALTHPTPTKTVYDLGQNIAGWPHIRVQGPAGAILRLTPGELLNPDGTVSQRSSGGPQWWTYTLRGGAPEDWSPRFSYYGFRYIQAEWTNDPTGKILALEGQQLSSNSPATGTFASSSPMLNAIHHLIVEGMHNNEATILTDCPHREKLGWLEETHLVSPGLFFNNDLRDLIAATERNIADAQLPDGMVPTIAPRYVVFGNDRNNPFNDSPEWGSASILAPWTAYRFYGDIGALTRAYPAMQAYLKYLESRAKDGIVAYGLGDWYDIGPGEPGVSKLTSLGVTGTLMLYEDAATMQKIATLLHHPEDAATYAALAERERQAFNRRFWNEQTNTYDKGSQTANAMPLALGLVPEERRAAVLEHIIADIHAHHDHVTTGEVGYPYMMRALMQAGRSDVLLAMLLRTDAPSYGAQLAAGATSLTEAWDANPRSSQDHFMLGGAEEFFYRGLGGIDLDLSRSEPLIVRPAILPGLDWVKTSYLSSKGRIETSWKREPNRITLTVTTPTKATLELPNTTPKTITPGTHTFHLPMPATR